MALRKKWSVIAVTCPSIESAYAVQKELEIRQRKGCISPDTILLAVDDPQPLIGTGSATSNALVLIAEHLSIRKGYKFIDPNALNDCHILIMHMGRQSALSPCGSAFVTLPAQLFQNTEDDYDIMESDICCNIDLLLSILSNKICIESPPGVWVTSCDMILSVPEKIDVDWSDSCGVHVVSVPSAPEYAKNHGIIKIGDKGIVEDLFYLPTTKELEICHLDDGKVPVLPVIIFLSQETSKRFFLLHASQPLENCTFIGLDNGAQPIQISFLFDILLCMAKNLKKEEFVSGERSMEYDRRKNKLHTNQPSPISRYYMKHTREALWNGLRDVPLKTILLRNVCYNFLFPSGTCYSQIIRKLAASKFLNHQTMDMDGASRERMSTVAEDTINEKTVVLNSVLKGNIRSEKRSVIMHCNLKGNVAIESDCFLAGLNRKFEFDGATLTIPSKTVVQEIKLKESSDAVNGGYSVITIAFGIEDNLTADYTESESSFCNKTWTELFQRTGIKPQDLWNEKQLGGPPCLLRARLFPVFRDSDNSESNIIWWLLNNSSNDTNCLSRWRTSQRLSIEEIMSLVSFSDEFFWRRNLFLQIGSSRIREIVSKGSSTSILPFLKTCVNEGLEKEILSVLDDEACSCDKAPGVARTLSHIADVLNIMAGRNGGLRSGPAKNPAWKKAVDLLQYSGLIVEILVHRTEMHLAGKLSDGVMELAAQRERWMGSPFLLTRCARHYEGAEQTLIQQIVLCTKQVVNIRDEPDTSVCGFGLWVTAEAPARVDLSGGWSDTPPITYEHGGTVTNVALKIDGKRPIGAKIRKIPESNLVLVLGRGEEVLRITCRTLDDIRDFSNPSAPGALLKSAFLCTNTITFPSEISLETQLRQRYGCGFELRTWSELPHGSGLGTSSILSGVICAAILRILGRSHDDTTLVHLVIHLEQMLTTGGGWQDQVGGLLPGVKITRSQAKIPIIVQPTRLDISEDILNRIAEHTALIYTGKTRLAKYILQDVIRRWYARSPEILRNVDLLTKNAETCAEAWKQGNLEKMGECLNSYRKQKKVMATGCEPDEVREIINAIQTYVYGCCLAGAGGGGFLFVITKKPNIHDQLKTTLEKISKEGNVYTVHRVEVDNDGLTVQITQEIN